MKEYQKPEIIVIKIDDTDIVTTSGFDMEIDVGDFEDE